MAESRRTSSQVRMRRRQIYLATVERRIPLTPLPASQQHHASIRAAQTPGGPLLRPVPDPVRALPPGPRRRPPSAPPLCPFPSSVSTPSPRRAFTLVVLAVAHSSNPHARTPPNPVAQGRQRRRNRRSRPPQASLVPPVDHACRVGASRPQPRSNPPREGRVRLSPAQRRRGSTSPASSAAAPHALWP